MALQVEDQRADDQEDHALLSNAGSALSCAGVQYSSKGQGSIRPLYPAPVPKGGGPLESQTTLQPLAEICIIGPY